MTTKSRFIISLISLNLLAAPLRAAQPPYFAADQLDPVAILPPPPGPGSAEDAIDLATTVAIHKACNAADMAAAKSQENLNVCAFTSVVGAFFQPDALPATKTFFDRVGKTTDEIMHAAKDAFRRPRPYTLDPSLAEGQPESTSSYPSGHSMAGTVNALVLADIFPGKRDDILAFGRAIGWHRVQFGKHYPTDVYAGRVLAMAIYRQLKANPDFQHDFAAAKAELTAASASAASRPAPQPAPVIPQPALVH